MPFSACPDSAILHVLTFVTEFRERNTLPGVSQRCSTLCVLSWEEALHEVITAYDENKFSPAFIDCAKRADIVSMRVLRILTAHGLQMEDNLVYKWYEAQVRLHLFAKSVGCRGPRLLDIVNMLFRSLGRPDLNLLDLRICQPFCERFGISDDLLLYYVPSRTFTNLVRYRDMGDPFLSFNLLNFICTVSDLVSEHCIQFSKSYFTESLCSVAFM